MDEADAWLILAAKVDRDDDAEVALAVVRDIYFDRWHAINEYRKKYGPLSRKGAARAKGEG
jgi:hypothetical protein